MPISTPATTTSVPRGWVVHVEVQLGRVRDGDEQADGLPPALVSRAGDEDAAVTIREDHVLVTWHRPHSRTVSDAGQALTHALDETLQLLSPHVAVTRVRRAWTEVDGTATQPRRRLAPDLPRQQRPVQPH